MVSLENLCFKELIMTIVESMWPQLSRGALYIAIPAHVCTKKGYYLNTLYIEKAYCSSVWEGHPTKYHYGLRRLNLKVCMDWMKALGLSYPIYKY